MSLPHLSAAQSYGNLQIYLFMHTWHARESQDRYLWRKAIVPSMGGKRRRIPRLLLLGKKRRSRVRTSRKSSLENACGVLCREKKTGIPRVVPRKVALLDLMCHESFLGRVFRVEGRYSVLLLLGKFAYWEKNEGAANQSLSIFCKVFPEMECLVRFRICILQISLDVLGVRVSRNSLSVFTKFTENQVVSRPS